MPVDNKLTEEEKRKGLINIREFINATKDFVDVGMYLFPKMIPHAAAVLGVAYLVKNLIAAHGPEGNEEVLEELGKMRTQMDSILDRMAGHFTAFKAFLVENHFYNDVPLATTVLYEYMQDVTTKPSEDSLREFKRQYEKTHPLKQARKLIHQLETDVSNPLRMAMMADPLMSKETFQLWRRIIESVFTQLWDIEIRAGVLIHNKEVENVEELYRVKQLKAEIEKYHDLLKKWEHHYETNAPYWPEKVKLFVEDIQDKHKDTNQIAELIQKGMDKIYTKSLFYIVVFSDSLEYVFAAHKPDKNFFSNRNGTIVMIYRSAECRNAPKQHISRTANDLRMYKSISASQQKIETWIKQEHIERWANVIRDTGILLAIHAKEGIVVKSTKTDFLKNGPGGFMYGTIHSGSGRYYRSRPFFLLAGFR